MSTKLDLKQLSIDRSEPVASGREGHSPRRRWFSRFVLPVGVVLGFLLLVGAAAGRRLLPVRSVSVAPVIVKRAQVQQAGQPLFQAPGWVEPRPTPVNVPALAAGVVEQLHVVEGQRVEKGETIARLITTDAELAVRRATATLALRESEHKQALAERSAAEVRFENPVHLQVMVAEAESQLAEAQAELAQLPYSIRAAETAVAFAQENVRGKRAAGDGVSGIVKQQAMADLEDAQAELNELQHRQPNVRARTSALQRKVEALQEQLDLLIEEKRQLEEARAKVERAAALRDEAQIQLEEAELQLSRMVIRSPLTGRVLKLVASPGDRVMGLDTTAEHRSSTIVQMYDPERLQVRVDVRLEDVPLVVPGQPVEIETMAAEAPIAGQVLQPTSAANIQKNTLEVKVAVLDPPATLTPEMLVTATFFAPESDADEASAADAPQRLFVPSELVKRTDGGAAVWLVDAEERAQRVAVEPGGELEGGLTEIVSGVNPTDKLITGPTRDLSPGQRVTVTEDTSRLRGSGS